MAPHTSWDRLGLGPQPSRRRHGPSRLRPRLVLALSVSLALFLWLVLPYDNTLRLAVYFNLRRLRAAVSAPPGEGWAFSPADAPGRFPVDVGRDVVVVLKTGYGTRERVPAWLDALPRGNELREIVVVADSEGRVDYGREGLVVYDAVGHSVRAHLRGWEGHGRVRKYRMLGEALARGEGERAGEMCREFGWELDAMKFLSGLEMTYQKYPDKRWYLLVDDDTYIIQPSLKPLLEHLDHRRPYYLGNAVGDFRARFAHGGSAIVLSHGAMRALVENQRSLASFYVDSLDETWGDRLLAKALLRLGIHLDEAYSHLFNGEPPRLTKMRADRLCSPLLSFHKLPSPAAMREVGEAFRNVTRPVAWNDLWARNGFAPPWRETEGDTAFRKDWDHVGDLDESTLTVGRVRSAEACKRQCDRRTRTCLAWAWDSRAEVCHVSHWMIVGKEAKGYISGVNVPRARALEAQCRRY